MTKLILAANRLPVTVDRKKIGKLVFNPSVGGLATGMSSLSTKYDCLWVGFSGMPSDKVGMDELQTIRETLNIKFNSYPVPLTNHDIELYYNGFANKTIWPLFHYFQFFTSYNEDMWRAYADVNEKFFDAIAAIYHPGDLIWIHDYHLMLLPGIIRKHLPDAKIGFFLHIPFPSFEVFRLLPWRREILDGLIGADLIGFHTFGYVRHFLSSAQRIAGIDNSMGQLNYANRIVKCDAFPMGIDYRRYSDYLHSRKIAREISEFKQSMGGKKMILSVDRLDFTKGIIERLNAFALFLKRYPRFHGKVQMVLVNVPSRTEVDTYIKLRKRINEQIGRINGKYNTLSWSPIQYLYRSLPFEMIMTLYHCADVCLVTPLRDGMNLVAKEYIAARVDCDGVLILSEMAGASEELGEALIVNPNNREEVAEAIAVALSMPESEQCRRVSIMQRRLQKNDVFHWSASFIEKLLELKRPADEFAHKHLTAGVVESLLREYHESSSRLLLVDYDGTLVQFVDRPDMAIPDEEVMSLLADLTKDQKNDVAIISGRSRDFLERYFSGLRVLLVAEHGAWMRLPDGPWKSINPSGTQWKNEIRPVLESYCDQTPGTFIEEKEFSLAWHYRRSDSELASIRARELKGNLLHMVANHNLGIMEGNKVLEIKSLDVNKGKIAGFLINAKSYDFILAVGDDVTDEDLFSVVPEGRYSVKVGYGPTRAGYILDSVAAVRRMLARIGRGSA